MKKVSTLKSILYNTYFKTALVPLIVIEVTLLVLYFGISKYMVNNSKTLLSEEIKTNLITRSKKETQEINYQLREISDFAYMAQYKQQLIFKNKERFLKNSIAPEFAFADNNTFYKVNNNGGASLLYGATTKIGKEQREKAIFTEAFDEQLKYLVDSNELIVAAYFNSYDQMNRLYPFIENVYSQYPADIKMQNYNFYYEADEKHNPQRKTKWTSAYLDPAGQGWMVSCIVPIYNNDFLEGVTGLDVTIDKFVKNVLNLNLPWNASAMLVGEDGLILAMPKEIEKILNIKELTSHNYEKVINDTNLKPDEFNIYKNEKLKKYFQEFKNDEQNLAFTTINEHEYIITQSKIEQTNWKLFIFVDKEKVFEPVNELDQISKKIGFIAIFGMILFYLLFFMFLSRKIKEITNLIANPISLLAKETHHFDAEKRISKPEETNIKEIDTLANNFYKMTNELYERRNQLKELNNSLEERVEEEVLKNREKDQLMLHQSKLAQMGEMISMIAHQWRQPLATINSMVTDIKLKILLNKFNLEIKKEQEEFKNFLKENFENIEDLINVLSTTIDDFRNFYKPVKNKKEISVKTICEKTISILKPVIRNKKIELIEKYDSNDTFRLYENELIQVLLNIIKNAIDNFEINNIENKTIEIETINSEKSFKIIITDNGGGIASSIKDKIFEPYFSTKDDKNGTGLGLYMSKIIIEQYQKSKLYFENKKDGVSFIIELNKSKL
ncbi:sensor histidine kinase [Halarcobacter bivalviorum]|uniref:histidine kinase n=1 Tax=Halarcobacter bivalviorum TaxID=663364 RepID=A0AAX2AAJ0_9BACT|nr:sensor histidine kinase [Halarcobacter bivalviorum]AXH12035.1 two-component system sensor histidine kinase [Halarcobacter bivalviorum]RXK11148.1 hypothetical protein CRV05_01920 [Halarcobacter bivalviorum]